MYLSSFVLVASLLLEPSVAIDLHKRQDGGLPRVVRMDTDRRSVPDPVQHDRRRLLRRDNTVSATLVNEQTLYYVNASIGTPKQRVRLHIDTGSSDLWTNAPNSTICESQGNPCDGDGTYDPDDSSTSNFVNDLFNISYADGSAALGDYVTDNFYIGDSEVQDLQLGVGYESSVTGGILGIGYEINEAQVAAEGQSPYQNLPARMAADGMIASNAYSLWLNDLQASKGNVLFGGVDQAQYEGDLVTVPIQEIAGQHSAFFVTLTGIDLAGNSLVDDMKLAALLDSGTTLTYLPVEVVQDIYNEVGAFYREQEGVAFVPCDLANLQANLTFRFSDPLAISVAMDEMVLDVLDIQGAATHVTGENGLCLFGIAPSSGTYVLGDTFLRSAYVVYDLSNNEVSMAQSRFNATDSDVVEIGKGRDAVPQSTSASDAPSAQSGLPGGNGGDDGDDNAAGSVAPPMGALLAAVLAVLGFSMLLL